MWIHNLVPFIIPVLRLRGFDLMWYAGQFGPLCGTAYGSVCGAAGF